MAGPSRLACEWSLLQAVHIAFDAVEEADHDPAVLPTDPSPAHLAQPYRRFAHVPVLGERRYGQRLAPGAPGQPRGGWRRAGDHRGHGRVGERTHLARRPRYLVRRARRTATPHHPF